MKPVRASVTLLLAVVLAVTGAGRVIGGDAEEIALQTVFGAAIKKTAPFMVALTVEWKPGADLLRPALALPAPKRSTGRVSGVVLAADGFIVTSDFNVNADAKRVTAKLADGRQFEAKVLGRDVSRGIQLLHIDAKDLPVPRFVAAEQLKVGRWALACGIGELPDAPTLSVGIVSATERITGRAVQVDASTNPTNYGGPLIDIDGNVIGIITPLTPAGSSEGISLYDSGVGFAVPVSDILNQLPRLKAGEIIRPAFLGIRFDLRRLTGGATVNDVLRDTGAEAAGIKTGDVIVEFNREAMQTSFKLLYAIGRCRVGDEVKFKVVRDGKTIDLTAKLGARPEPVP